MNIVEENTRGPRQLVIISAGTSTPSSSRMLADRVAQSTIDELAGQGIEAEIRVIELGPLAGEIAHAIVSGFPAGELLDAVQALAAADGIIVAMPVYKAGMSGLFKSFVDVLDNDLLIAKPVALSATAGSARHALVVEDQMRPLFAYMRALTTPTAVFAAPEDWSDPTLKGRISRVGIELAALIASDVSRAITGEAWDKYQHTYGGNARPGSGESSHIDFDTDLMRLATGG